MRVSLTGRSKWRQFFLERGLGGLGSADDLAWLHNTLQLLKVSKWQANARTGRSMSGDFSVSGSNTYSYNKRPKDRKRKTINRRAHNLTRDQQGPNENLESNGETQFYGALRANIFPPLIGTFRDIDFGISQQNTIRIHFYRNHNSID